ncbi:hypothetical protein [Streptomyces ureilyticus]|uniref:Lipoprotein n=1 Tax=Streptomyces ureilyticus TaxID=1775131 RepID=A0ABX0DQQ5_9ACTN|nr:hypothetical protein [Streptomyces ureilyticus]NGO42804.1 hypothetical protein [Streptomyces ureilyticus]
MARRIAPIAATFAATAALLITACGGGDDSSSPDDIKGADTGSKSPSASASASTPSEAKRPEITLPSTFQLTFEDWTSSEPVEQAILNDAKEEVRAGYAAIIANEPDGGDALAFYDTENGLAQSTKWIKSYTDKNVTVIGELPAFDPKVSMADSGKAASLSYCTDESKAFTKNRKTGKEVGNPAGTDPEVAYTATLVKSAQGVWQNDSVTAQRGGCSQ